MRISRLRSLRGQTLVEVMMAMALLLVASAGLVSLQRVSVTNNAYARELGVANAFGQHWLETLKVDAQRWRYFAGNQGGFLNDGLSTTSWLNVVSTTPNAWFRPGQNPTSNAYAAGDAFGRGVPDVNATEHEFCASVRLNWLFPRTASDMPSIRADVRVHWSRLGLRAANSPGPLNNLGVCDSGLPFATLSNHDSASGLVTFRRYNFTYLSTTVLPTYFN